MDGQKFSFRKLKAIDDVDEQNESIHVLRQVITRYMMDASTNLKEMSRVAKNSSSRAYAGHLSEFKHVLNMSNLNLTEYARSFGIYKIVHESMPKYNLAAQQDPKPVKKRPGKDQPQLTPEEEAEQRKLEKKAAFDAKESSELFTRRL